jgi:uroporphyrinogen-III decarboxylase
MEKSWADMTWQEKRELRFEKWRRPAYIKFETALAEKDYQQRVNRFIAAIKCQEPDRVPVWLPAGNFAAYYAGCNLKTVMNDYELLKKAWLKFLADFEMDAFMGPGLILPAKVLDMIGYRLQKWPGHGLADNVPAYQYVEGEYMPAAEYEAIINDPADWLLRTFLPRSCVNLKGFSRIGPITPFIGIPVFFVSQFADPEIRRTMRLLLDAAEECAVWQKAVGEVNIAALQKGVPAISGGMAGAPFDMLGDFFRGTAGIMMDMYRRPQKILAAVERLVPAVVAEAVGQADASGCPIILMPLHKGTDHFMSPKQFETFYWPTLHKVMMGLIEQGCVPMPFAEGYFNERLATIKRDMPATSAIWFFEHTDMVKAKKVLGGHACIAGNLPVTVMMTGTPQDVKAHCRRLLEACAPGGGYILTGGAQMDEGDPRNLHAIMEAVKEYYAQ